MTLEWNEDSCKLINTILFKTCCNLNEVLMKLPGLLHIFLFVSVMDIRHATKSHVMMIPVPSSHSGNVSIYQFY